MAIVNADNKFALNRFTVHPTPGQAAFTTVQAAVDAADAAGGGTVFLSQGTYNEAVTITSNVSLICPGSGAGNGGNSVSINGGVTYDTSSQTIDAEVSGITFDGAAGIPGLRITGANGGTFVASNCHFAGTTQTCLELSSNAGLKMTLCSMTASSGVATFNITAGQIYVYNSIINGNDTRSTVNSAPGNNALFYYNSIVFDSYNVISGQLIMWGCLVGTISTLSVAIVETAGAVGFPQSLIVNDTSATGYIVDGNGPGTSGVAFFFSFSQAPQIATQIQFDPDLIVAALNEYPYGQAGVTATAIRGSVAFDSNDFSVTNGFASLLGTGSLQRQTITSSGSLSVNNGYYVTSGALSLSLPATSAVGDVILVVLKGGTSWAITQGAGQSIQVGSSTSTVGTGGSVASIASGDALTIECVTANTAWVATSFVGNLNVT